MSRFRRLGAGIALAFALSATALPIVSAQDSTPVTAPLALEDLQLQAIKDYLVEHVDQIVTGNTEVLAFAQE
jgi:hypothetical protein